MPDLTIKPEHVQLVRTIAVVYVNGDDTPQEFTNPNKAVAFEAEQLRNGKTCKLYSKEVPLYYYESLIVMGL